MRRAVQRSERLLRIHRRAEDQTQHPAHLVVQRLHVGFALAQEIQIGMRQIVVVVGVPSPAPESVRPRAELHVQSVPDRLFRVVDAAPVRDHNPVEPPFPFQDVVQQVLVVAAMLSLILVIGPHHGPRAALLHGGLECRKVDLVQSPVVDLHVDRQTTRLLIVQRKVFHARRDAVLLHLLHVGHDHARSKVRVFAHVFEVAAVERRAVDVHARAQQHVLLPVAGLLADRLPVERRHRGVPRRGKARQRRKGRTRVVRPARLVPFVPKNLRADAVRTVRAPHLGDTQARNTRRREFRLCVQHGDLLFKRHTRQGVLDTFFKREGCVLVGRKGHVIPGSARAAGQKKEQRQQFQGGIFLHFNRVWLKTAQR